MYLLDLTLPTPAENLALDEALLDAADAGELPGGVLRLWESDQTAVVVGRASRVDQEVNREACAELTVPILRRHSGGTAVVIGRGCLLYAVVLSLDQHPQLRLIDQAHQFVLQRLAAAINSLSQAARPVSRGPSGPGHNLATTETALARPLSRLGSPTPQPPIVTLAGTSDLAIGERKISGNSLRIGRTHLLYHGTVLYDFDLPLIGRLLGTPPREPEYRAGRPHDAFVTNLNAPADDIKEAITTAWSADDVLRDWPKERTESLVRVRYSQEAWNLQR